MVLGGDGEGPFRGKIKGLNEVILEKRVCGFFCGRGGEEEEKS